MLDQIGAFLDVVGGILSLDLDVILGVQTAANGLLIAVTILLLATVSDVISNSPILFFRKMQPRRLAAALGIETILSIVRLLIWLGSFWIFLFVLNQGTVDLTKVVLVVGIGYAPMLWSFLVVIPTIGPLIGRILVAWTLVTITASIAVAVNLDPWQVLTAPLGAVLVLLVFYRYSGRVSATVLGRVSRQLTGVDLMRRTRAMDPMLVMAARDN